MDSFLELTELFIFHYMFPFKQLAQIPMCLEGTSLGKPSMEQGIRAPPSERLES